MSTAELITYLMLIMFGGILVGFWVEQYFLRRKKSHHAH